MTEEQVETIVQLYKDGASFNQIGAEIDKTADQVKHWMRMNRGVYGLDKRRAPKITQGVLSEALWTDSKWNIKRGVELISRRWHDK